MDWRPYNPCCQRLAASVDAAFCPECGHPFLRCLAFAECKTLVTPDGRAKACSGCVAPQLMIAPGAAVKAETGQRLSVQLILMNVSPAGRPFWVKRMVKRTDETWQPLALNWDMVEARGERAFSLHIPPIAEGGTLTAGLIMVLASRYKGVEEEYAFETEMQISFSSGQDGNTTYNITNTNSTYYAPVHGAAPKPVDEGPKAPATLNLQPAEVYELEQGIRGYRKTRLRVPRHVEFSFTGFPPADRPDDGVTIMQTGRLACGRNARTPDPSANAMPSDLVLRAYTRTGEVDEPATLAISRHHFDFIVVNDRLCVHARSTRGLELNGKPLETGQVVALEPGDRLVPIPGRSDKLAIEVDFSTSIGSVERVEVSRSPAVKS